MNACQLPAKGSGFPNITVGVSPPPFCRERAHPPGAAVVPSTWSSPAQPGGQAPRCQAVDPTVLRPWSSRAQAGELPQPEDPCGVGPTVRGKSSTELAKSSMKCNGPDQMIWHFLGMGFFFTERYPPGSIVNG